MLRVLGAIGVVLLLAGPPAAAQVRIAAFYGVWEGNAVSESAISEHFRLTSRDIGVEVRPAGDGFSLTWQTVQRQRGDPANPTEQLKSATVTFRPARPGVWQAEGNADPIAGGEQPYAWAYIRDNTLRVTLFSILPDGRHDMQIYERTLTGTGMELRYSRLQEGAEVRIATGRLVKVAN